MGELICFEAVKRGEEVVEESRFEKVFVLRRAKKEVANLSTNK